MSDKFSAKKNSPKKQLPADVVEVREPRNALPGVTLDHLPEPLQTACKAAGWTELTPVQSLAIPYLLDGRDIMVQSRTGSGKTGCYLLPMLEKLDPEIHETQALVLVPTRELALQVEREATTLFTKSGLKACAVYGGVGYDRQLRALKDGVQLVIGTPGRVLDHLLRRSLKLHAIRELVFDEADRMLSIGFYPDMKEIARHIPQEKQTCLFSATYPPHVMQIADEFMRDPEMLSLSHKEIHVAEVEHLYCLVQPMDRDRALVRLLEAENPSSAVIFCNTKAEVHYIAEVLQGFGYRADELSGDLSQQRREAVLAKIRNGSVKYLVSTDVAARGIDIPGLSHVFLYEPPEDKEVYIHRAGRTGRAGAAGTVISLVDQRQRLELERVARNYKINLREIPVPNDEEVSRIVCARLNTVLESRLRSMTGLERMRASRYLPLAKELVSMPMEDEENTLALIAMILDDSHRVSLHESRFPKREMPVRPQLNGRGGRRPRNSRPRPGQKRQWDR